MRFLAALGALCFLAGGSLALAQVQVSAQTERSNYLLYERVDLLVTVANVGESDVVLNNEEGHPWLSFLVSKHNHLPVRQERNGTFKQVSLKAGESKTLRINLTPLFSFREEGNYNAAAVIDLPGEGQVLSGEVPFSVMRGRQVWTETRPVDGSQRVYSLLRFSPKPDMVELYLRVEDPTENVVYANTGLGQVAAYIDPDVFFDPQGNVHVLQLISMSTYLYTRTDSSGKVLHQAIFKTFQKVRPQLAKMEDGNVMVNGGMEEDPSMARESLSDGQKVIANGMEKKPDTSAPDSAPASTPNAAPDAAH